VVAVVAAVAGIEHEGKVAVVVVVVVAEYMVGVVVAAVGFVSAVVAAVGRVYRVCTVGLAHPYCSLCLPLLPDTRGGQGGGVSEL
jgi:Zn-dependent protease